MIDDFSSKELEVFKYAALPIKEISKRLNLSEATIKGRFITAIRKINQETVANRHQAQLYMVINGHINLEEIVTE